MSGGTLWLVSTYMRHDVQFITPTGEPVDGLLSDFRWLLPAEQPRVLYYHFADEPDDFFIDSRFGYDASDSRWDLPYRAGFGPLGDVAQQQVLAVLAAYEAVIDVRFEPVADPLQADFRLALTDLGGDGETGRAYPPYSAELPFDTDPAEIYSVAEISGDVWLDDDLAGNQLTAVLLAEIGQALGMSAALENGYEFIEDVVYATLPGELATPRYTVQVTAATDAQTIMALDIEALQSLYGVAPADTANSLYIVNQPGEEPIDPSTLFYPGAETFAYDNGYLSIVDAGGYNALYLAALDSDLVIDLTPGSWSTTHAVRDDGGIPEPNLYLAPETGVLDVVTGSGNDRVVGNDLGNVIVTAAGNDEVFGGSGDDNARLGVGADVFHYGGGNDRIDGNNGFDTVVFGDDSYRQYKFAERANGLEVTYLPTGEISLVRGVERLVFGDEEFATEILSNEVVELNRGLLLSEARPLFRSDIGTDEADPGKVSALEAGLYRTYYGALGRLPDEGGFGFWLNEIMENGASFEEVATGFLGSPEFIDLADTNDSGNVSAEEFVAHMYRNVFGRQPDEAGFNWWLDQLYSQEFSTEEAFVSMVQSDEFVQLTAGTVYDYLFL